MVKVYVNMGYLIGKEDFQYFGSHLNLESAISYMSKKYKVLFNKGLVKII